MSIRVAVGGQLRKNEISDLVKKLLPNSSVLISTDLEAAMAVQMGNADLYLGACDTGGGGALAMAVSLLGVAKAKTIATQSSRKSEAEILKMVQEGVIAFGFVETLYEYCVTAVIDSFKKLGKA